MSTEAPLFGRALEQPNDRERAAVARHVARILTHNDAPGKEARRELRAQGRFVPWSGTMPAPSDLGSSRQGSRSSRSPRASASASDPRASLAFRARIAAIARDVLPLAALASAIVGVPVLVFEPQGLPRLRSLERELEQVESENHAIELEIGRLRGQVHALKDDPAAAEKVARRELGLVRKSEIVLQLPRGTAAADER
jgi:cell division protein FtsB